MIFVCFNHIIEGIQSLNVPHVQKTSLNVTCRFCQQPASFELDYDKQISQRRGICHDWKHKHVKMDDVG